MKHRAFLNLTELMVMVLVFALGAAICLACFAEATLVSRETDRLDRAVLLAQNGAEILKASAGDWEAAAVLLGGTADDDSLTVQQEDLLLTIRREDGDLPGLGRARAEVTAEGQSLLLLTVSWQEVAQ